MRVPVFSAQAPDSSGVALEALVDSVLSSLGTDPAAGEADDVPALCERATREVEEVVGAASGLSGQGREVRAGGGRARHRRHRA